MATQTSRSPPRPKTDSEQGSIVIDMELDNHKPKVKAEIQVQKRQEKEKFLFAGELRPDPNQRVFELDMETFFLKEAKYFTESKTINYMDVVYNTDTYRQRKILIKSNHDYIISLNIGNAIRKFYKRYGESRTITISEYEANKMHENQRKILKYKNQ